MCRLAKILVVFSVFVVGGMGFSEAQTRPKMTGPPQISSDGAQWWRIPGGLLKQKNKDWSTYTFKQGLPADTVYAFAVDSNDHLWCTHGAKGVSVFDGSRWTLFDHHDVGFMGPVRAVKKAADGALWFGTHQDDLAASDLAVGLLRYKDGQWLRVANYKGSQINHVHEIETTDGGLKITGADGQTKMLTFGPKDLMQVEGQAVHPITKAGVANLPVRLMAEDGLLRATTMTDAEGRFTMQAFPGTYVVSASNGVALSDAVAVELIVDEKPDVADLTFPFEGEIGVQVVDSDGAPVKGATVLVSTNNNDGSVEGVRRIPTDLEGQVRFWTNINSDTDLEVVAPGFMNAHREFIPIDSLLVGTASSPRLVMKPGHTVRGYVVSNNRPVANATVMVWRKGMDRFLQLERVGYDKMPAWWPHRKTVQTDKLGAFAMGGFSDQEVELVVMHSDFLEKKHVVLPEEIVDLQIISLDKGVRIVGTVTGFDRPLGEMQAMAYPMKREEHMQRQEPVTPNSKGEFELTKLKPGKHMLALTASVPFGNGGFMNIPFYSQQIDLAEGTHQVALKPLGEAKIRGQVFLDGKPLPGTMVNAGAKKDGQYMGVGIASTDENGFYELTQLPNAEIFLGFQKMTSDGPRRRIAGRDSLDLTGKDVVDHEMVLVEVTKKEPTIGQPAPAFTNTLMDGKTFSLASLKGKVVVLDFWATWCGPCVDEIPNVRRVYEKYKSQGLEIVGISLDRQRKALEDFVKKERLTYPQVYDDKGTQRKISEAYGVWGIPAVFLIDENGVLQATGLRGDRLEEEVRKALKKKNAG